MRYRVKTTKENARLSSHSGHLQEGRGERPQRIEHETFAHRGGDVQLGPSGDRRPLPVPSRRSSSAYRKRFRLHVPITSTEQLATDSGSPEPVLPGVDTPTPDQQRPLSPPRGSAPARPHLRFERRKPPKPPATVPEGRGEPLHADHGHLLMKERPAPPVQQQGQARQPTLRRRLKRGPQHSGSMASIRGRGGAALPTAEAGALVPREHLLSEAARRQQARPKLKPPRFRQGRGALTAAYRSTAQSGSGGITPPSEDGVLDSAKNCYGNLLKNTDSKLTRHFSNKANQELSHLVDTSENTALQAADRERRFVSYGAGKGLQWGRAWNRGQEQRVKLREAKASSKSLLRDLKEQKNEQAHGRPAPSAVRRQKKALKRKQIRTNIETRLGAETTARIVKVAAAAGKAGIAILRTAVTFIGFPLLGVAVFSLLLFGLLFGGLMLLMSGGAVIASSYLAEDAAIHDASIHVSWLEAKLEKDIQDIPNSWEWGHIDEFRYDLDPIGHEPLALMAYLTVKYQDFEGYDIPYILERIHEERYQLELHETSEKRDSSYTDENGEEVPDSYTYYILTVTLQSRPLEDIIFAELDADPEGELWEWYDLLMETRGNHQAYANPFDFDWLPRRTSLYGWRIDPVAGRNLQVHRGLDIAAPTGTPIRTGLDGTVLAAVHGDAIFGNFLIIGDDRGRELKYAHCDRLLVRRGDPVVAGETIMATVGNTGASTGSHLHIEVKEQGQYRNPMYMIGFETEESTT